MPTNTQREELATALVDSIYQVHVALGPGLLESTYQVCLQHELSHRGIRATCDVALPVRYRGLTVDKGFRIDMIIADSIIVENKSVVTLLPVHQSQLITYLKLAGIPLG